MTKRTQNKALLSTICIPKRYSKFLFFLCRYKRRLCIYTSQNFIGKVELGDADLGALADRVPGATMGDPIHDKVMWKRTVKQGFRTQGAP